MLKHLYADLAVGVLLVVVCCFWSDRFTIFDGSYVQVGTCRDLAKPHDCFGFLATPCALLQCVQAQYDSHCCGGGILYVSQTAQQVLHGKPQSLML